MIYACCVRCSQTLGRAAYRWLHEQGDTEHFDQATAWATRVHSEVSADMVLQACIFEAIYPPIDAIFIPDWVFKDLGSQLNSGIFPGVPCSVRSKPPPRAWCSIWYGGGVPDIMRDETVRWFYYLAVRYLKAGYEAIHLGQAHLIAGMDRGYRRLASLCSLIRQAAARYGR